MKPGKGMRLFSHLRIAREKAHEGHLPLGRQMFEMILLYIYRGLGPGYYLLGRFWRREMSLRNKLRHLNQRGYVRQVAKINNPMYHKLSQHKVVEKAILSLFKIPTPKFLGFMHSDTGRTCQGEALRDARDLAALLETEHPTRVCFKLVEGWSGIGFQAAEVDNSFSPPRLRTLPDCDTLDLEAYVNVRLQIRSCKSGRFVEEYCRQHPWYQSLNPTSVNTLRVYTILPADRPAHIIGGYLRIGRTGSIIDNISSGGIFFPLDPETGVLKAGRLDSIDAKSYSAHPDTRIHLEGIQLPNWQEVRNLIPRALEAFPNIRFAGLDIAMTEDGPTIIELNVQPDRTAVCDLDMSTLDMLTP
jgi:hypothetical protein